MSSKVKKFIKETMAKQMKAEFKIICDLLNTKKRKEKS